MTIRLTLLAPAAGPAARRVLIDDDAGLDAAGRERARQAANGLPPADRFLSSPARRCRDTAHALGVDAAIAPALRELDLGRWHGRTLDDLAAVEPEALAAWTTDPAATPHGGESVDDLCRRVAHWLDALPPDTGRLLAVVGPGVARAGVLHALAAPTAAFWRIDVPPLAAVQLTARSDRWNVRFG